MKRIAALCVALGFAVLFSVSAFADAALPYERAAYRAGNIAAVVLPAAGVIAVIVVIAVIIKKKNRKNGQAEGAQSETTEDKEL